MAKYGAGEKSTIKCTTCDYEKEIQLSGTHESEGGSLKVYCEDEEFVCPNCGELNGNILRILIKDNHLATNTSIFIEKSLKNSP